MSSTDISLVKNGTIGELVLNRPLAHNAISTAMWRKIPALLGQAQNDHGLHVLLVHGGRRASFSAGANISELAAMIDDEDAAMRFHHDMSIAISTLANFPKPVIARIKGPCIGAGLALALACDIRIAAADARFGVTPAKLGLTYPLADTQRLVALVGPARAKDLILSSRLLDADEALSFGLVEQLVPTDKLADLTHKRALQMGQRSGHTQTHMKAMINSISAQTPGLEDEARQIFVQSFSGQDSKEGFAAFAQKRKPDFSGG